VRKIFARYLWTHSLVITAEQLNADGHATKRWRTKAGHVLGGRPLTSQYIYRVLTNATYLGRVPDAEAGESRSWSRLHNAIISQREARESTPMDRTVPSEG